MKELYIAPEVKLIGYVSAEKIAAEAELPWGGLGDITLANNTNVSKTDIRIPLNKLT